ERAFRDPRLREQDVQADQEQHGDAERLNQPRYESVQASDDAGVVQIVVVQPDDEAERQRERLAEDRECLVPIGQSRVEPEKDAPVHGSSQGQRLEEGEGYHRLSCGSIREAACGPRRSESPTLPITRRSTRLGPPLEVNRSGG